MRPSQLSSEFQLILHLCQKFLNRESFDDQRLILFLKKADIKWDRFCFLVRVHRVISLVYESISQVRELIPEPTLQCLGQLRKKTILCNFNNLKATKSIQDAFDQNSIDVLFLKGLIYSQELYGDVTFRHTRDIDIVVREKDLEKSVQVMAELGFAMKGNSTPDANMRSFDKHLAFYSQDEQVCVELHWSILDNSNRSCLNNEEHVDYIFSHPRIVKLSGVNIKTLPLDAQFIHLLHHGTNHEWGRFLRIIDFVQTLKLFKEEPDRLNKLIKDDHLIRSFSLAMRLAYQALHFQNDDYGKIILENRSTKIASKIILKQEFEIGIIRPGLSVFSKFFIKIQRGFLQLNVSSETRNRKLFFKRNYVCGHDYKLMPLPEKMHLLYIFFHPFFALYRHFTKYRT